MQFYRLTRGSMDEAPRPEPRHISLGYGLIHVDSVVVVDYRAARIKADEVQRAVHSYANLTGKRFKTCKTVDKDRLIIKRIA